MTPDHEAAKKWAKRMLTPEGLTEEEINLSRAYLDLLAQRDEADKLRDVAYGLLDVAVKERDEAREELAIFKRRRISETYLDGIEAQRDEATELLRALKARLDRYESITGDDYADLCAFLAKHRKTGATDGK